MNQAARPPVWLISPSTPSSTIDITQHALKGQKLLAQGNALGIMSVSNAPCKGKSFKIHIIKKDNPLRYEKLLPLQGARFATHKNPGRCPGLGASAPSGRAAYMGFLSIDNEANEELIRMILFERQNREEWHVSFWHFTGEVIDRNQFFKPFKKKKTEMLCANTKRYYLCTWKDWITIIKVKKG